MEYIAAPWRAKYVKSTAQKEKCFLCTHSQNKNDRDSMILFRGKENFIIINRYPYTPGHILISPYRHLADPAEASKTSTDEMMDLLKKSLAILKKHYHPHGFNTGMNLGQSAGAGVTDHYHMHVLPRWTGDSNFMPIVGKTKVVIETLEQTYEQLAPLFQTAAQTGKKPNKGSL